MSGQIPKIEILEEKGGEWAGVDLREREDYSGLFIVAGKEKERYICACEDRTVRSHNQVFQIFKERAKQRGCQQFRLEARGYVTKLLDRTGFCIDEEFEGMNERELEEILKKSLPPQEGYHVVVS